MNKISRRELWAEVARTINDNWAYGPPWQIPLETLSWGLFK